MIIKLFASALIAALLLTGTATEVSLSPGQGAQSQQPAQLKTAAATNLTEDRALAIALEHAGLTEAQISRLEREFDWDDGRPEWDIEFTCNGFEYSYEIHAETGAILDWEKERDD